MTKICGHCKEDKPISLFDRDCRSKDGYHGLCKECRRPGKKRWRDNNRDVIYEWNISNKEYIREASKKSYARRREEILAQKRAKGKAVD